MKKSISVFLAVVLTLCSVSCLSLSVGAGYEFFDVNESYTVESGTSFRFCPDESGMYEFTSYDNFDPVLTVVFEDGTVESYDDVDFDNFNYEFSVVIELEAGEEIYCTVEDGEGNDVSFYISRYYEQLYADEEYTVASGYEFIFVAEEEGTFEFTSFDNNDPYLEVEFADGSVETYDDISDEDSEFSVLLNLDANEEIFCTVYDYGDYDVTFTITEFDNLYADESYTADNGYRFFFTAEQSGYYNFVSNDNEGDPYMFIVYDGEEIIFDDWNEYEFDGGIYLNEGDYIYAIVDDNFVTSEEDSSIINFSIWFYGETCPGHYESAWCIEEEATVYNPGMAYMECDLCGEIMDVMEIPQFVPATPKVTGVANTASGVKVTWGDVEGADDYIVYRRVYNAKTKAWSGWSRIASGVTGTSYVDKTAKSGTYYIYTVKANNEAGYGGHTSGLKIYFLSTPKITSTANTNNAITVKWGKVAGASGYVVYRKTTGGWTKVATVKGNSKVSYTDKTAEAGVTYKYTVRAYYGSYLSSYNTKGVAVRRLTTPSLKSVTSAKAGITLKWGKVTGATGYIVYRKTGNGSWQKLATVKGNTKINYLDKTAKKGVTYRYTVRAYYGTSTSYYNTKGLAIKDKY